MTGRAFLRVITGGLMGTSPKHDRGAPQNRTHCVIIVDDDPVSVALFTKAVNKVGVDVSVHGFSNPAEALAFTRRERPALAIVDVHFDRGEINGLELIQHIRAQAPDAPPFQTILISADKDPEIGRQAAALDVQVVIHKAINAAAMMELARALLELPPRK